MTVISFQLFQFFLQTLFRFCSVFHAAEILCCVQTVPDQLTMQCLYKDILRPRVPGFFCGVLIQGWTNPNFIS